MFLPACDVAGITRFDGIRSGCQARKGEFFMGSALLFVL